MGIYTVFYNEINLNFDDLTVSKEDIEKIKLWVKEKRSEKNFPWVVNFRFDCIKLEYDKNHKGDLDYFLVNLRDFLIECAKYNIYANQTIPYAVEEEAGAVFINSFYKLIKIRGFNDGDIVEWSIEW